MADSRSTIRNTFPLPVYNYRVTVEGESVSFSEVTGLALQYEPITYRHGLSWKEGAEHMPGMKQPIRVTLRKGLIKKGRFLSDWIGTIRQNKAEKRTVVIDLCDEKGIPLITWKMHKAFPLKLEAPGFNASSNEVAIEALELLVADLEITYH